MASKIVVNLDTSKEVFLNSKCKQNDDLILECNIFENGLAKDLTNCSIVIQALKADKTYIIQNTDIIKSNNKFTANLVRDFTRVSGKTEIEIVLTESSKQNTTFSFCLEVVGSVIRGAVESKNTVTILENLQDKIEEAGVVKQETEQLIEKGGAATKGDIQEVNAQLETIMSYTFEDINRSLLYKLLYKLNSNNGTVCFVGDSITEGNANGGVGWFVPMKPYFPNLTFINKGKGGKTTGDFINNYMAEVVATNADVFIIALGCNDIRYSKKSDTTGAKTQTEYISNITNIVTQLKEIGEIIIINPWMTTVKDYTNDITISLKEQYYKEWSEALRKYCANNAILYIDTNTELNDLYNDLEASLQFTTDGVHPNSTNGVKLYTNSVLFGNQKREDYINPPILSLGKNIYKLEILSHYGDSTDRVWLKNLLSDVTILDIYGNVNRNGYNDVSKLIQPYDPNYSGYINLTNDYPIIITFSTNTPIDRLIFLPENFVKSIGEYRLYYTSDKNAIANPKHSSWVLISYNIPNIGYKRCLYYKGLTPRFFYKLVIKSPFDSSNIVRLKKILFDNEVLVYWSDLDYTHPIEQLFDVHEKEVEITDFTNVNIIVGTANPCKLFNVYFNQNCAIKEWEIWQSSSIGALTNRTDPSWVKTRSGTAVNGSDFIKVTIDNRFDPYLLSPQKAPTTLDSSATTSDIINFCNNIKTQLINTKILNN